MSNIYRNAAKLTQLTVAGTFTQWVDVGALQAADVDMNISIGAIGTSVTFKPQYSEDGSTVVVEGLPVTITNTMGAAGTGNGIYNINLSPRHKYVRVIFVVQVGTTVTIDTSLGIYTN